MVRVNSHVEFTHRHPVVLTKSTSLSGPTRVSREVREYSDNIFIFRYKCNSIQLITRTHIHLFRHVSLTVVFHVHA